jgi:ATP-binding cassette, subfamily F, member 3
VLVLRNLTLARGAKTLLEKSDLTLHAGQKVGVIGPNGSGKSTLFALLCGEIHQESGDLEMPPQLTIARVAQETSAIDQAALEYTLDGDAELRAVERELVAH